MKKIAVFVLVLSLFFTSVSFASAADIAPLAKSAILMEQSTGEILYEKNSHEKLPPASITKVMTLLLAMEAIDNKTLKMDDMVSASEQAASMGGTQIWLKPGEQMSVRDIIKAIAVVSANDASFALGEHIAGSNGAFVEMMNTRARELGMNDTTFMNPTGLDAEGHLSSAYDIAVMSRELMKHDAIKEFTTIWMDSLRGGANELVNTNKLVRFYDGCTGLKTGTTDGAGSCLSATASRNGLSFVAVVMGCATSDDRFNSAKALLDTGFSGYVLDQTYKEKIPLTPLPVNNGKASAVDLSLDNVSGIIIKKSDQKNLEFTVNLPESISAPVSQGQIVGEVIVTLNGEQKATINILAAQTVQKLTFGDVIVLLISKL